MHAVYNVTNKGMPVLLIEWYGTEGQKPGLLMSLESAESLRDSLSEVISAIKVNTPILAAKKGKSPKAGYAQGKTCASCGRKRPCKVPNCGDISGFNEWMPKK